MNSNYHGLQIVGSISKILGVVGIFLGFVSLIVAPLALSSSDALLVQLGLLQAAPGTGLLIGLFVGVVLFFLGSAAGMLLFAIGECFNLLIAIEANTRKAAALLEKE